MNIQSIKLGVIGKLSIFFILLLIFLTLCQILYGYEQDITKSHSSLYSRPHSRFEVIKFGMIILMIVSHFYIHESKFYIDHAEIHLGICLGCSITLTFIFLYYLPYYHTIANFTHAAAYTSSSIFVIGQVISLIFKETTILVIFFMFITPLLVYFVWDILQRRRSYIKNNTANPQMFMKNIYERELSIRILIQAMLQAQSKDMCSEVEVMKTQIKDMFQEIRKEFYFNKLVSILEFLYFFSVLEDEPIARLKLSFAIEGKFDIEHSYAEFKCRKLAEDHRREYSEEIEFIKYKAFYDKVKKIDEKACSIQLEFWNELSSNIINVKKIETLSYALHRAMDDTFKQGKELYEKHPEKAPVLRLYGSFLMDIYNHTEKGNELLSKSENIRANDILKQQNGSRFSYFDENAGVMIVSGSPDSVGMVDYVSPEAYSILGLNISLRHNLHISNFSPPPMNNTKFHNMALIRFLITRNSYEINLPLNTFVMNSDGFLVEVLMQMKCMALDSFPFFIVSMKRAKFNRECMLFDSDYSITAHSKYCASLLRFKESKYLLGMNLNQLIPGLIYHIETQDAGVGFVFNTSYEKLFIQVEEKVFRTIVYRIIYITNSSLEARSWTASFTELPSSSYSAKRDLSANIFKLGSAFIIQKGIIKNPKLNRLRKNLSVSIDEHPTIYILPWSDFKPGKSKLSKDAMTIKIIKASPDLKLKDMDKKDDSITSKSSEIVELKRLATEQSIFLSKNREDSVNRFSSPSGSLSSHFANSYTSLIAQKLILNVNSSIKRFKVAFLLTNMLVIISIATMVTYLILSANLYKDDMLIPHICTLRYNTVTQTEFVRFLHLHYILSKDPAVEQIIRTKLTDTVNEFDYYIKYFEDKLSKRPDEESNHLYQKKIPTYLKEEDKYTIKEETLIDALRNLNIETKNILATPSEYINPSNPHFYYLMRNGVEETAKALNDTVFIFLDIERQNIEYTIFVVNLMGAGEVFIIIICFFGVILPTLIQIERANQNVWRFFYSLKYQVIHEMKFKSEERLEIMHGIEQFKDDQISSRFKNTDSRRNTQNSNKWKGITLKLTIYYFCSAGLFIYIYAFLLEEFAEVIKQKPMILNWGSMIVAAIEEGFFWGTEVSYLNTTFGYFNIIPQQQVSHPLYRMNEMIELWDYSEHILISKLNLIIDSSSEQEHALFVDGCIYPPCQVYLKLGIHPALMKIRGDVPLIVSIVLPFEWAFGNMSYKEELIRVLKYLLSLYEDILNGMIQDCVVKLQGVAISYCVLMIILFMFIYMPAINKVKAEVTNVWDNTRLIPFSLIQRSQKDKI